MHLRGSTIGVTHYVTCRNLFLLASLIAITCTQEEVLDIQDLDLPYDTQWIVGILLYNLYN